tara:strand:- start:595 stop:807 length:213 start_codon:yes stop_codon:yes gene_type:complete
MSDEKVETIMPEGLEIQPDPYEENNLSRKIIKFCCNCGIEFSEYGRTEQYFGCRNCGVAVKISVLDSAKH